MIFSYVFQIFLLKSLLYKSETQKFLRAEKKNTIISKTKKPFRWWISPFSFLGSNLKQDSDVKAVFTPQLLNKNPNLALPGSCAIF